MSRIDFAFGVEDRFRAACEVARRQFLRGRKTIVYTKDMRRLSKFDHMLWEADKTSLIPHALCSHNLAEHAPIILTDKEPERLIKVFSPEKVWLLNLDIECPPGYKSFELILEIVSNIEE